MSTTIISVGAVCFGVVLGYVTYRTLVRKDTTSISDIAAVVGAVGGGFVAERFDSSSGTDTFGWYSIGLLVGFVAFLVLRLTVERPDASGTRPEVLGDEADSSGIRATVLGDD